MGNAARKNRIIIRLIISICFLGLLWGFYYSKNKPVENNTASVANQVEVNSDHAMAKDHVASAVSEVDHSGHMMNDHLANSDVDATASLLAVKCDQDKKCVLPNGDMVQFVGLTAVNEPFDLIYSGKAFSADKKIMVGFSMKSMNMGVTNYSFVANGEGTKEQIIKSIKLPVCAMGHKDYYAAITVEGQTYEVAMEDWLTRK